MQKIKVEKFIDIFSSSDPNIYEVEGRVKSVRKMKNTFFLDIVDDFEKLQIIVQENLEKFEDIFVGDYVKICGEMHLSKTGEQSLLATEKISCLRFNGKPEKLKEILSKDNFRKYEIKFLIRKKIRDFFSEKGFIETDTKILSTRYNGGRSFPVYSSYLNNVLGYNRTTLEEKMQELILFGFENIFQIGNIFRSDKELTFLEGYVKNMDLFSGEKLIIELCSYLISELKVRYEIRLDDGIENIVTCSWRKMSYLDIVNLIYSTDLSEVIGSPSKLRSFIVKNKFNVNIKNTSDDSLADALIDESGFIFNCPTIVSDFPIWCSPLYKKNIGTQFLERAKMYLPYQTGGFDLGIQENNFNSFKQRLDEQKSYWAFSKDDIRMKEGELSDLLSCGVLDLFGFGLNPDRFINFFDL